MATAKETRVGPNRIWLTAVEDGEPIQTAEVVGDFSIGRDGACDFVLDDPNLTRLHAKLAQAGGAGWRLCDLGSSNGTLINGRPLTTPPGYAREAERFQQIFGGEVLQFGDTVVVATVVDPATAPAIQALIETPESE
jgi:pSer/pThr/pTyr-binding forkhead associated (FHA) protein